MPRLCKDCSCCLSAREEALLQAASASEDSRQRGSDKKPPQMICCLKTGASPHGGEQPSLGSTVPTGRPDPVRVSSGEGCEAEARASARQAAHAALSPRRWLQTSSLPSAGTSIQSVQSWVQGSLRANRIAPEQAWSLSCGK